jgi:thiamine-phosphate pyrophosphorylase
MKNLSLKGYYFITDANLSRAGNIHDVKAALAAGVEIVQYREKLKSTKEMHEEAWLLRKLCKDIIFLINDRVDIAQAVCASGVHLGQSDMPYSAARKILGKKKIIGVTVHSLEEAKKAHRIGADYLGISPIFKTLTKPDTLSPVGVELIRRIRLKTTIPLVAIGGINLSNAQEVIAAGADCVCAISAVVSKNNVRQEIRKFQKLFSS